MSKVAEKNALWRWQGMVDWARDLTAAGRGDDTHELLVEPKTILGVEEDRRVMRDLWAKHGDRADALAEILRDAVDYGGAWTVEQWRAWVSRAAEATVKQFAEPK